MTRSLVTFGETMVMVTPSSRVSLREADHFRLEIGGAESNTAAWFAYGGGAAHWGGIIGADPLGERVRDRIEAAGVHTSVDVSESHPTGLYVKDPGADKTAVYYYRRASAGSTLSPSFVETLPIAPRSVLHLTGITPALSRSATDAVDRAIRMARDFGATVSFDVNYRPGLWTTAVAAAPLRALCAAADIVFVGLDEAHALWGTRTSDAVRHALPNVPELVIKDGAVGVTAYSGGDETFEPSPRIEIVEVVGAGDAYAAGYLLGLATEQSVPARLRSGHRLAGIAMQTTGDLPPHR